MSRGEGTFRSRKIPQQSLAFNSTNPYTISCLVYKLYPLDSSLADRFPLVFLSIGAAVVRLYEVLALLFAFLLFACAGSKKKEEERIRQVLESSASYHIEKGSAASDSGRYEEAVRHFHEAIALVPYEPVAFNNLGVTFFRVGELDSAINAYQTAIRLRPGFARAYLNLANVYLRQNNYQLAIAATSGALKQDPSMADAYALRGMIYEQLQQLNESLKNYQAAVNLAPNDATYHLNLGAIYYHKGMLNDAVAQYEEALKLNPNMPEGHFNMGNAFARKCMQEEAKEQYRKALQIQPKMISARNNLGLLLMAENQRQQAIEEFRQALAAQPNEATVLLNLSIALERSDSLAKALELINRAIRLDSSKAMYHLQRGNVLLKLDANSLALSCYKKAIELEPNQAISYNNLGNALISSNDPEQATLAFEKALELYPDYLESRYFVQVSQVEKGVIDLLGPCADATQLSTEYAEIYNNLGKAQLRLGQLQNAEYSFRRATELQPSLIEPFNNLGIAYYQQSKRPLSNEAFARARLNKAKRLFALDSLNAAADFCEQAIRFKPELSAAYSQLGLIHGRLGKYDAADAAFRKALSFGPNDYQVHLSYGQYLARRKRWQEAKVYLKKAVQLDSKSSEACQGLAEALSVLGEQQEAARWQAHAHYLKGQKLEYAANWDQALEEYAIAARLDSANANYLASQGLVYAKKHLHPQADSFFVQALQKDSSNSLALYGAGLILGDQNKHEEAISYLTKALASDSTFAAAHYALAVNYYFEKNYNQAWHHIEQARKGGHFIKREFINELKSAMGMP